MRAGTDRWLRLMRWVFAQPGLAQLPPMPGRKAPSREDWRRGPRATSSRRDALEKDDVLVVTRLDRLARSPRELFTPAVTSAVRRKAAGPTGDFPRLLCATSRPHGGRSYGERHVAKGVGGSAIDYYRYLTK